MDITPTSFRILKFINSHQTELFTENNIINKLRINNRQKIIDSIQELQLLNLAGGGKGNISYKLEGEKYYNEIIRKNNELIYNDAIEDYDYAILKFLHYNDWGVKEGEFPSILKQKCQIEIFSDYLYQQRINIKNDDYGDYFLTEEGEQYYCLETKRKESIKEEEKKSKINFLTVNKNSGVILQGSESSESPINQSVTTTPSKKQSAPKKKRWYNSPLFKYFIWPLLVLIIGYLIVHFV